MSLRGIEICDIPTDLAKWEIKRELKKVKQRIRRLEKKLSVVKDHSTYVQALEKNELFGLPKDLDEHDVGHKKYSLECDLRDWTSKKTSFRIIQNISGRFKHTGNLK